MQGRERRRESEGYRFRVSGDRDLDVEREIVKADREGEGRSQIADREGEGRSRRRRQIDYGAWSFDLRETDRDRLGSQIAIVWALPPCHVSRRTGKVVGAVGASKQGRGSYEDRTEMLRLIVDLVEASIYADNSEWSVDEQMAKDIQLIDAIAEKQAQIFSEECKLFPADVQIQSVYPLPDISDLEKQLADQSNRLLSLQEMVDDLASKHAYNPDEDYVEVEAKLRTHLESFLETARSFNIIYTKEIRPWTHMMEVPQIHGFGPASNRLLEAYKMLLKFLGNLRNLRDSHAAVAVGSSETITGEPSSVTRIISECESSLTLLNRDLGILSASIARVQGEEVNV